MTHHDLTTLKMHSTALRKGLIKEPVVPFSLNSPRQVAIPVLPKKELERMENLGLISHVE